MVLTKRYNLATQGFDHIVLRDRGDISAGAPAKIRSPGARSARLDFFAIASG